MNNLSITSSVFRHDNPATYTQDLLQTLGLCRQAGFEAVDLNLAEAAQEGYPLAKEGWEQWVDKLGEGLAQLGLRATQAHSLVFRSAVSTNANMPNRDWFEEKIRRTIWAAGRLNVPWLVFHPTDFALDLYYDCQKNRAYNLSYWPQFVEQAIKAGVGVAFENLYPSGRKLNRYCANYEELIDLVDSFRDAMVGICWDTGHALLAQQNQVQAISAAGARIKVTHLHDNQGKGKDDEHLLPYLGVNDWPGILSAFQASAYAGPLSLEVRNESGNVPGPLKLPMLQFAHSTGSYMAQQVTGEGA